MAGDPFLVSRNQAAYKVLMSIAYIAVAVMVCRCTCYIRIGQWWWHGGTVYSCHKVCTWRRLDCCQRIVFTRCSIHHPQYIVPTIFFWFYPTVVCSSAHSGPGSCPSLPLQDHPGCRGLTGGQAEGFSAHQSAKAKVCSTFTRQLSLLIQVPRVVVLHV